MIVNSEFIRNLRSELNYSTSEFAKLFDATHQTVMNWENNKSLPSTYHAITMINLRKKLDKEHNDKVGDLIKGLLLGGGIGAFLYWIFSDKQ